MEETYSTRYGERERNFHAFSRYTTLPKSPRVCQPKSSLNFALFGFFMDASLHSCDRLNRWPLADFPGGPVIKNSPCNAGDSGLNTGPGRYHMTWHN